MQMYARNGEGGWIKVGKKFRPVEGATSYFVQVNPKLHDGKRVVGLGRDFEAAKQMFLQAQMQGDARNLLNQPVQPAPAAPDRLTLAKAAADFIAKCQKRVETRDLAKSSLQGYSKTVNEFAESCGVIYLDEVNAQVLLDYKEWLHANVKRRKTGKFQYTLAARFRNLNILLADHGITMVKKRDSEKDPGLLKPSAIPRPPVPEGDEDAVGIRTYSDEDLNAMLQVATQDETDLIFMGLHTGFRVGEIRHAEWLDIDWAGKLQRMGPRNYTPTIIVRRKDEYGFRPKSKRSRFLPLTPKLLERLNARKARMGTDSPFIFPNTQGGVDRGLYLRLNRVLDKLAKERDGERIGGKQGIHRLRKTFATKLYEKSNNLVTAQHALGHADIETTRLYLGVNRDNWVEAAMTAFAGIGD